MTIQQAWKVMNERIEEKAKDDRMSNHEAFNAAKRWEFASLTAKIETKLTWRRAWERVLGCRTVACRSEGGPGQRERSGTPRNSQPFTKTTVPQWWVSPHRRWKSELPNVFETVSVLWFASSICGAAAWLASEQLHTDWWCDGVLTQCGTWWRWQQEAEISAEKIFRSDWADHSAHSREGADISRLTTRILQTPQFQIDECACHDDATQAQHRVGVTTGGRGWLDRTHECMVPEHATNTWARNRHTKLQTRIWDPRALHNKNMCSMAFLWRCCCLHVPMMPYFFTPWFRWCDGHQWNFDSRSCDWQCCCNCMMKWTAISSSESSSSESRDW